MNRIQTLRSSTPGARPSGRAPGERYTCWPDKQLGVIDPSQTPMDLIGVRFFSATANYVVGDLVVQAGQLYKAISAVSPGAFNLAQWATFANQADLAAETTARADADTQIRTDFGAADTATLGSAKTYADAGDATTLTAAETYAAQAANAVNVGGFVNKFRNGAFDVWQRGGLTAISVPTSGAYVADGWVVWPTGAAVTVQQAGARMGAQPNGPTRLTMQVNGAVGVTQCIIRQRIEQFLSANLCNQPCTFQIWMYNGTGAAVTPQLSVDAANAPDNFNPTTPILAAINLQPCPNGQWTRLAYTFSVLPAAAFGLQLNLITGPLGAGASATFSEADLRATPDLPVGLCANPPPPELRPIATELAFCQRYFETSYPNGTAPGTPNQGVGVQQYFSGLPSATYQMSMLALFKAQKRAAPSVSVYSPVTGTSGLLRNIAANTDNAAIIAAQTVTGFIVYSTNPLVASSTINTSCAWTASAEL